MTKGIPLVPFFVALGLTACAARTRPDAAASCQPPDSTAAVAVSAGAMAGSYQLTMVATSGPRASTRVQGTLTLREPPEALRERASAAGLRAVLVGTSDLEADSLGAPDTGDLQSVDPIRPGVLVLEQPGPPPRLLLRLGSEANRQDQQPFESAYWVLEVLHRDAAGFSGNWSSGLVATTAAGYFCAVRR